MDLLIHPPDQASWGPHSFRCALGRNGVIPASAKQEGDGATPAGRWPLREVYYRADRLTLPSLAFPVHALNPDDGWCDDPTDAHYNRHIRHPTPARAEHLWREDHLYDVIVVLGYNDAPISSGKGSAIFLHAAPPDFSPSAGCVTLALKDLLHVLAEATPQTHVAISL